MTHSPNAERNINPHLPTNYEYLHAKLKEATCRKCGLENDQANEYCADCQEEL